MKAIKFLLLGNEASKRKVTLSLLFIFARRITSCQLLASVYFEINRIQIYLKNVQTQCSLKHEVIKWKILFHPFDLLSHRNRIFAESSISRNSTLQQRRNYKQLLRSVMYRMIFKFVYISCNTLNLCWTCIIK